MTRKGSAIDGFVVLDKPLGLTSAACVARVKRALGAAKVGHGGTLDPLASGVLVIALGEGTKLLGHMLHGRKRYRFAARWGEARETDDREGEVTATSMLRPTREAILAALPAFTGTITQTPPVFSALKQDGRAAHERARAGETVTMVPRSVEIESFILEDIPDPDHAVFEVACGPGTYVRALARDLAVALGTVGHVAELRRLAVGPYRVEDAISLEKLEGLRYTPSSFLRPVETALVDIPALAVTEAEARSLRFGQAVPRKDAPATYAVFHGGRLIAIGRSDGAKLVATRGFNLTAGDGPAKE